MNASAPFSGTRAAEPTSLLDEAEPTNLVVNRAQTIENYDERRGKRNGSFPIGNVIGGNNINARSFTVGRLTLAPDRTGEPFGSNFPDFLRYFAYDMYMNEPISVSLLRQPKRPAALAADFDFSGLSRPFTRDEITALGGLLCEAVRMVLPSVRFTTDYPFLLMLSPNDHKTMESRIQECDQCKRTPGDSESETCEHCDGRIVVRRVYKQGIHANMYVRRCDDGSVWIRRSEGADGTTLVQGCGLIGDRQMAIAVREAFCSMWKNGRGEQFDNVSPLVDIYKVYDLSVEGTGELNNPGALRPPLCVKPINCPICDLREEPLKTCYRCKGVGRIWSQGKAYYLQSVIDFEGRPMPAWFDHFDGNSYGKFLRLLSATCPGVPNRDMEGNPLPHVESPLIDPKWAKAPTDHPVDIDDHDACVNFRGIIPEGKTRPARLRARKRKRPAPSGSKQRELLPPTDRRARTVRTLIQKTLKNFHMTTRLRHPWQAHHVMVYGNPSEPSMFTAKIYGPHAQRCPNALRCIHGKCRPMASVPNCAMPVCEDKSCIRAPGRHNQATPLWIRIAPKHSQIYLEIRCHSTKCGYDGRVCKERGALAEFMVSAVDGQQLFPQLQPKTSRQISDSARVNISDKPSLPIVGNLKPPAVGSFPSYKLSSSKHDGSSKHGGPANSTSIVWGTVTSRVKPDDSDPQPKMRRRRVVRRR